MFALARNGAALDALVDEIRANGGAAHAFTCDVTDSASVEHTVKDILGRFDHVDYLVNNAGRSIRRSVVNSTDRLHDYERVMAVNYFGAVRMVLALLPHWRERRFGHVVNVSSAGVQARNPKYSSYLPTKAALDAFADVVGSEVLSDHITFTNIHMPLVRTPMIVPSHRLNPVRAISPEAQRRWWCAGWWKSRPASTPRWAPWPRPEITSRPGLLGGSCTSSTSATRTRPRRWGGHRTPAGGTHRTHCTPQAAPARPRRHARLAHTAPGQAAGAPGPRRALVIRAHVYPGAIAVLRRDGRQCRPD